MPDDKLTVEDMVKAFFSEDLGLTIHFGNLAVSLRQRYPDATKRFAENVVNQVCNKLAKEGWLTSCGRGEFRKSP